MTSLIAAMLYEAVTLTFPILGINFVRISDINISKAIKYRAVLFRHLFSIVLENGVIINQLTNERDSGLIFICGWILVDPMIIHCSLVAF